MYKITNIKFCLILLILLFLSYYYYYSIFLIVITLKVLCEKSIISCSRIISFLSVVLFFQNVFLFSRNNTSTLPHQHTIFLECGYLRTCKEDRLFRSAVTS